MTWIEEKRGVPFWLSFFVFLLVTVPMGVLRPYWYDELSARWLAEAPNLTEFVSRVKAGVEPTPPGYLFIQYLALHALGWSEWTTRVPSMIGYGVALCGLYCFVKRRLDAMAGALAMAVMILSGSIYYAQEARPYGMVFGATALAMCLWQKYVDQERAKYVIWMAFWLFLAASLHYYAVLLGVPFGIWALSRIWIKRRIDWGALVAASAPGIALIVHLPLIRLAMSEQSDPKFSWSQPSFAFPAKFWERALEPGLLTIAFLTLLVLWIWRGVQRGPAQPARETETARLPLEELILLTGFILIPVGGTIFAKLVTNAITPRYVFTAMLGYSVLAAHVLTRLAPAGRAWILALLLVGGAGNGLLDLRWLIKSPPPGAFSIPEVAGAPPAVVDDYLLYAVLGRYAPPEVFSRLVYVTDRKNLTRYTKSGQMELGTVVAVRKGQFPGRSDYLDSFLQKEPRFLLFEPRRPEDNESFLSRSLWERGATLSVASIQPDGRWFLVERGAAH